MLKAYPKFDNIKLIKIDTDGFDTKIIKGSRNSLLEYSPCLFFEFDFDFLKANDSTPWAIFSFLHKCGYCHGIGFDNYGKFFSTFSGNKIGKLRDKYFSSVKTNKIRYLNICVFTKRDTDLRDQLLQKYKKKRKN